MSRADRIANLLAVVIPFVAFVAALVLLWERAVGPLDLGILAVMYMLSGLGVTVGFHRLLTHRAFETYRPLKYLLAVLGSLSVQGSVIHWVADHRKHHAHTDEEGDPHSPHIHEHGKGAKGVLLGLVHAHFGWLMTDWGQAPHGKYARDIVEDRGLYAIHKWFVALFFAGL